ncbi:MAG: hypothetical protein M1831_003137 [Alyxoria varia]|nr:MAG: hypothetical protein M1831_003137 [Alyxoria varia]
MKRKFTAALILAAFGAVSSSPHPREEWPTKPHPPEKAYTLQAMRSLDDEVQLKHLQARDGSIRLGGKPNIYCPPSNLGCPATQAGKDENNSVTAILLDATTGRAQLDVAAPPGQILYVSDEGKLSYTAGLNGNYVPEGAYQKGFTLFDSQSVIGAPKQIIFDKAGATSWYACKELDEDEYTVYADVKGFTKEKGEECRDFMAERTEFVPTDGAEWAAFQPGLQMSRGILPKRFDIHLLSLSPRPLTASSSLRLPQGCLQPFSPNQIVRQLADVRNDKLLPEESFSKHATSFVRTPVTSSQPEQKKKEGPEERTLRLGNTVRTLHERLPTLLASPLPQETLAPNITLHLFPSTHPHLPTVSGRLSYTAALWTAPVAWGRVPVVGNVKLIVLSERMVRNGPTALGNVNEKLIVRWKTCGKTKGRGMGAFYKGIGGSGDQVDKITEFLGGDVRDDEEFSGLFIFEFDESGRIASHTIEHVQQGPNFEQMTKVFSVTDWLIGLAKVVEPTQTLNSLDGQSQILWNSASEYPHTEYPHNDLFHPDMPSVVLQWDPFLTDRVIDPNMFGNVGTDSNDSTDSMSAVEFDFDLGMN